MGKIDYAIASAALGCIERSVGPLEDKLGVLLVSFTNNEPYRNSNRSEQLTGKGELTALYRLA